MKLLTMLVSVLTIPFFLAMTACSTIEGEVICGVWNTNSEYGKMTIEITPWKGKFHGYMLQYDDGAQKIMGAKTEDFVILYDLVYKEGTYENGKMIIDISGEQTCPISIKMTDQNQLTATYNCAGYKSNEIWRRVGHAAPNTVANQSAAKPKKSTKNSQLPSNPTREEANNSKAVVLTSPEEKASTRTSSPEPKKKAAETNNDTKKQTAFNVIGLHKMVVYNDMTTLEKVVETLWTEIYKNDFSGKLKNITNQERMYVVYSNYDNPKGKMTITIGYKVKDLSNVPKGLNGVNIPANDYYVSPLSGEASDYEGEAWKQFEELAAYRNANSADFEVYKFDENYEVTEAYIWIAAK